MANCSKSKKVCYYEVSKHSSNSLQALKNIIIIHYDVSKQSSHAVLQALLKTLLKNSTNLKMLKLTIHKTLECYLCVK